MSTGAAATVCMYRLNELGDCFLVTFTAGASTSRMLVDCGSFRNSGASIARIEKVTTAMAKSLGGAPLDVVVGTHQHNDHLSGFVHGEAAFRKMKVGQVWLSWLDNPFDQKAQAIGEAHHNLMIKLRAAHAALRSARRGARAARALSVLDDILGFYGASGGSVAELPAK